METNWSIVIIMAGQSSRIPVPPPFCTHCIYLPLFLYVASMSDIKNGKAVNFTGVCNEKLNKWKISFLTYQNFFKLSFQFSKIVKIIISTLPQTDVIPAHA
jgi:hypothetical protein